MRLGTVSTEEVEADAARPAPALAGFPLGSGVVNALFVDKRALSTVGTIL